MSMNFQELALVARRIEPWSWCGVTATEVGLLGATLGHNSEAACVDELRASSTAARYRSRGAQRLKTRRLSDASNLSSGRSAYQIAGNAIEQLWEFLVTGRQRIETSLDVRAGTNFQHQAWDIVRTIPFGETRSYGWVAEALGKPTATQALGTAVGSNQMLIFVPCHRVVGSRGIGGYSRGTEIKRRLLDHERSWPRMLPILND
jgi:methylated-DNA-[protein]-cysteine S-methyltransferase